MTVVDIIIAGLVIGGVIFFILALKKMGIK
jgi:hypothetical protein